MNAIGGYFELELPNGEEFHKEAIRLNTGRNAFEYVLKSKKYKKAYLPYYTCDVMLEPIKKLNIGFEFYSIDMEFRPVFNYSNIEDNSVFVYTNYYGLCDTIASEISLVCKNLIIDNSQAFYSQPLQGVDTFYSARKFFGVPDGAYLYTDNLLEDRLKTDISYQRFEHLLGRTDKGAEEFYAVFKKNDQKLSNQPIKRMSILTQKLLSSINYNAIADKRRQNFNILHSHLLQSNQLKLNMELCAVPLIYPLLVGNGKLLKNELIKNKVFVATYWPNVKDWVNENCYEAVLYESLMPIAVDQRYGSEEMLKIVSLINKHA